jgi:hypothetical protein
MVWTGYFARYRIYQKAGLKPISIANICPQKIKPLKAEWLAPKSWIYNWKDTVEHTNNDRGAVDYYIKRYTEENLSHLSPEEVWKRLYSLAGDSDAVLLCYEALPKDYDNKGIVKIGGLTPGTAFCHRHIVSEFLRQGGFECREYLPNQEELNLLKGEEG